MWPYAIAAVPVVISCGLWLNQNRAAATAVVSSANATAVEFYREHVKDPTKGIVAELVFNSRERITDAKALEEAKNATVHSIEDFLRDHRCWCCCGCCCCFDLICVFCYCMSE